MESLVECGTELFRQHEEIVGRLIDELGFIPVKDFLELFTHFRKFGDHLRKFFFIVWFHEGVLSYHPVRCSRRNRCLFCGRRGIFFLTAVFCRCEGDREKYLFLILLP